MSNNPPRDRYPACLPEVLSCKQQIIAINIVHNVSNVNNWYVQNVSTFPNTFAVVSSLICMIWIELIRTNVVFSRIALVSYFCVEIEVLRKFWKNSSNSYLAEDPRSQKELTAPRWHLGAAHAGTRLGSNWPPGGSVNDAPFAYLLPST